MSFVSTEMSPADIRACTCGNDGYNNGGMFGNDWAWIVILLLFGWGGRGFGGFGGGYGAGQGGCGCSPCATQADLAAGFNNSAVLNNLNDLKLGQAGIQQTLCQGFNGVNTAILQGFNGVDNAVCTLGYNTQAGLNTLAHQMSDCCCGTQRLIERGFADTNYNLATQACDTRRAIVDGTRDIIDSNNAGVRSILDFLTQDKIATLQAENQSLKFAASQANQNAYIAANQEAQTAEIIRRLETPCPIPAYVVPNPNCCYPSNITFGFQQGCGCCNNGYFG